PKVAVVKYHSKTRYRRNVGHRQAFTKVAITAITLGPAA
ncbi:MAG: bL21 family ribosomal protein, partial [Candidatus Kerfeldbacteria bacterium]|nr:bL21 family ribosomal protein [Candidatus Kerfeldbacteria bacterium]